METITTEQPKHKPEVLSAVEKTLAAHDLRLKPGQTLEGIVDGLKEQQVTVNETHGYLTAEMSGSPVHVAQVVEALATKQPERFFPRDPSGVAGRDQLDQAGKVKFIREQGIKAYEKLPTTAPTQRTVVLDKSRLTKADWMRLDTTTRATLAGQWGAAAVGKIMGRK